MAVRKIGHIGQHSSLENRSGRIHAVCRGTTSMNSGKSVAAAACCWVLSTMVHRVKGSKVTGTASLKDILHTPDLISGLCTSSPLHVREIAAVTDIPVMDAMNVDLAAVGPLFEECE